MMLFKNRIKKFLRVKNKTMTPLFQIILGCPIISYTRHFEPENNYNIKIITIRDLWGKKSTGYLSIFRELKT